MASLKSAAKEDGRSNIFKKLGIGVGDFGKWFASALKETASIAARVNTILKAEQPLEAPFVAGLSTVVADVEALIASSATAVGASGLNFPADSQVYQQFPTLIADFKKLAPVVEAGVNTLKGKTPTSSTAASSTSAK